MGGEARERGRGAVTAHFPLVQNAGMRNRIYLHFKYGMLIGNSDFCNEVDSRNQPVFPK